MAGIAIILLWVVIIIIMQSKAKNTPKNGRTSPAKNVPGKAKGTVYRKSAETKKRQEKRSTPRRASPGRPADDLLTRADRNSGNSRRQRERESDDLLTRANRNVQDKFAADTLKNEMAAAGQRKSFSGRAAETGCGAVQNLGETEKTGDAGNIPGQRQDLLDEVYRLIVAGPETSTYFGRDFVAEGVEMINRGLESIYGKGVDYE